MSFQQTRYPVDRNKVVNELARHNFHSLSEFSRHHGYCATWLQKHLSLDPPSITTPIRKALENVGIAYDDIKPDEPEPIKNKPVAKAPEPKTVADITLNELYSVIFRAVRDALKSE